MTVISGTGKSGASWTLTGHKGTGPKAGTWRIQGIQNMASLINLQLKKMKTTSSVGMVKAAHLILSDAEKTPPLVPVDLGFLRSKTFVTPLKKPNGDPYVVLGYNANYAAAVHEMMQSPTGKPINWSRPGSGPKWFEASLKRNAVQVIQIIRAST